MDISVFHRKVSLILLRKTGIRHEKIRFRFSPVVFFNCLIKAVYAEADYGISGKLQADLPAVSFDPGRATLLHTLIQHYHCSQVQAQPVM